jgi:hypothetical protein
MKYRRLLTQGVRTRTRGTMNTTSARRIVIALTVNLRFAEYSAGTERE